MVYLHLPGIFKRLLYSGIYIRDKHSSTHTNHTISKTGQVHVLPTSLRGCPKSSLCLLEWPSWHFILPRPTGWHSLNREVKHPLRRLLNLCNCTKRMGHGENHCIHDTIKWDLSWPSTASYVHMTVVNGREGARNCVGLKQRGHLNLFLAKGPIYGHGYIGSVDEDDVGYQFIILIFDCSKNLHSVMRSWKSLRHVFHPSPSFLGSIHTDFLPCSTGLLSAVCIRALWDVVSVPWCKISFNQHISSPH